MCIVGECDRITEDQDPSLFAGQVGWELLDTPALVHQLIRYFSTVKV